MLATSFATARAGVQALNAKAFAALQTQTQASFDHAKAMFEARQPQEAVSMQSEFIRKQFEAFAAQAKDFSAQWQKIATDTFEPLKHTMSKHFPA